MESGKEGKIGKKEHQTKARAATIDVPSGPGERLDLDHWCSRGCIAETAGERISRFEDTIL